jgi:hypothetical protein
MNTQVNRFSQEDMVEIINTLGHVTLPVEEMFDDISILGMKEATEVEAKSRIFHNLLDAKDYYGLHFMQIPAFTNTIFGAKKEEYFQQVKDFFRKEYADA